MIDEKLLNQLLIEKSAVPSQNKIYEGLVRTYNDAMRTKVYDKKSVMLRNVAYSALLFTFTNSSDSSELFNEVAFKNAHIAAEWLAKKGGGAASYMQLRITLQRLSAEYRQSEQKSSSKKGLQPDTLHFDKISRALSYLIVKSVDTSDDQKIDALEDAWKHAEIYFKNNKEENEFFVGILLKFLTNQASPKLSDKTINRLVGILLKVLTQTSTTLKLSNEAIQGFAKYKTLLHQALTTKEYMDSLDKQIRDYTFATDPNYALNKVLTCKVEWNESLFGNELIDDLNERLKQAKRNEKDESSQAASSAANSSRASSLLADQPQPSAPPLDEPESPEFEADGNSATPNSSENPLTQIENTWQSIQVLLMAVQEQNIAPSLFSAVIDQVSQQLDEVQRMAKKLDAAQKAHEALGFEPNSTAGCSSSYFKIPMKENQQLALESQKNIQGKMQEVSTSLQSFNPTFFGESVLQASSKKMAELLTKAESSLKLLDAQQQQTMSALRQINPSR